MCDGLNDVLECGEGEKGASGIKEDGLFKSRGGFVFFGGMKWVVTIQEVDGDIEGDAAVESMDEFIEGGIPSEVQEEIEEEYGGRDKPEDGFVMRNAHGN